MGDPAVGLKVGPQIDHSLIFRDGLVEFALVGERVAEQSFANQLRRRYPESPEYQALMKGQYD